MVPLKEGGKILPLVWPDCLVGIRRSQSEPSNGAGPLLPSWHGLASSPLIRPGGPVPRARAVWVLSPCTHPWGPVPAPVPAGCRAAGCPRAGVALWEVKSRVGTVAGRMAEVTSASRALEQAPSSYPWERFFSQINRFSTKPGDFTSRTPACLHLLRCLALTAAPQAPNPSLSPGPSSGRAGRLEPGSRSSAGRSLQQQQRRENGLISTLYSQRLCKAFECRTWRALQQRAAPDGPVLGRLAGAASLFATLISQHC